jgi:hypothetical protein
MSTDVSASPISTPGQRGNLLQLRVEGECELYTGATTQLGPSGWVRSLVEAWRIVSSKRRSVIGDPTDKQVGAAEGPVSSEFHGNLSIVFEMNLREFAIATVKAMWHRVVARKINLTWNFTRVRPTEVSSGSGFKDVDTAAKPVRPRADNLVYGCPSGRDRSAKVKNGIEFATMKTPKPATVTLSSQVQINSRLFNPCGAKGLKLGLRAIRLWHYEVEFEAITDELD